MAETGSKDKPTPDKPCRFTELMIVQLRLTLTDGLDEEMKTLRGQILGVLMGGLKPEGPLEAMLASHMVVTHEAILWSMRRAMHPQQSYERADMLCRQADKLTRSFNEQVATLTKLRGGTNQNVTVKYLHIGDGGQVIVGNVNGGRRGARRNASAPAALDLPREMPMTMPELGAEPAMRTISIDDTDTDPAPRRRARR